jgi:hypothetical protein
MTVNSARSIAAARGCRALREAIDPGSGTASPGSPPYPYPDIRTTCSTIVE